MTIEEMTAKLRAAENRGDQNAIDYWSIRIADHKVVPHEAGTWEGIPTPELAAQIERLTLYWRIICDEDGQPEEYRIDGHPVGVDDVHEAAARLAAVDLGASDLTRQVANALALTG